MRWADRQARWRGALLCALVTLVALAVIAPAAQARPPKTFYGVVPQVQLGPEELQRMGLGRVGTLRVSIAWAALDETPVPGDTNWELYDGLIGGAAVHGIQILPVFDNVPTWVAQLDGCKTDCNRFAPRSTASLAAWRMFLREIVYRYGPEGTFWAEHPEIPAKPIRAWQIWNEQNSAQYFAPEPDVGVYAKLVTEASRAIKYEDPNAQVILGGMFATPSGKLDKNASWRYLKRLYSHAGIEQRFDGVAIHPYSGTMRQLRQQVQLMRGSMKDAGDGRTGLWVTEIGWASERDPKRYYLLVGPKRQAALLRKSFRYFTRQRKNMHVKTVNWFSWRDSPPDFELCLWCPTSGLFTRETFKAKPAWRVFRRFTGGH